ncbi:MAG TPA: hypothetical protein VD769_00765 [Gaiellaceae bacterium]|nr:hypothetical protein [Gaiellaceae bacterium]
MRLAALLALTVAVPACTGLGPEPAAAPWPTTSTVEAGPEPEPLFTGRKAVHYRNAYRICSVFSRRELARQYGIEPKPRLVARTQARRQYERAFRAAAFRGCLHAFQDREPRA